MTGWYINQEGAATSLARHLIDGEYLQVVWILASMLYPRKETYDRVYSLNLPQNPIHYHTLPCKSWKF